MTAGIHILMFALAGGGFGVTAAFAARVRAERLSGARGYCTIVAETKQGNFFRVKNTTVGFIFYLFLLIIEGLQIAGVPLPPIVPIYEQTAIWIAAGMSFYLFYQLAVVLRRSCPLCYASQIINVCLMLCIVAIR